MTSMNKTKKTGWKWFDKAHQPWFDSSTGSLHRKAHQPKYAVYAMMGAIFVWAMYAIFSPSSKTKEEQKQGMGLNTDVPAPANSEMADDKRTAYQQEQASQMQQERMKTLEDFISMVQVDSVAEKDDDLLLPDEQQEKPERHQIGKPGRHSPSPAHNSVNAYRDVNRTLGTFYEQPKEDERVKQLTKELEDLKEQLENQPGKNANSMDEQLALMEKSYEMAAKYLPGTAGKMGEIDKTGETGKHISSTSPTSGKTAIVPVTVARQSVVSALPQNISDEEFVATYSQERNVGFYSPETGEPSVVRNTIRACIHDDQTISDGLEAQRNVRIRLTEPVSVGGTVIPANTILTGQAQIGERLEVSITSIEYMGRIYTTDIVVYDVDGQRGIAIPPSMEVNALKEIAANAGTSAGTSVTFGQNAGQQLAAEAGRGLIQGTSQYFARKVQVMKIHLKAGHQIFLLPKDSL